MVQVTQWSYTSRKNPGSKSVLIGVRSPERAGTQQGEQLQE